MRHRTPTGLRCSHMHGVESVTKHYVVHESGEISETQSLGEKDLCHAADRKLFEQRISSKTCFDLSQENLACRSTEEWVQCNPFLR